MRGKLEHLTEQSFHAEKLRLAITKVDLKILCSNLVEDLPTKAPMNINFLFLRLLHIAYAECYSALIQNKLIP